MKNFNLAVLASGSGTNLQAIIDAIKKKKLPAKIKIVISNNNDAYALKRARKNKIKTLHLSHKQFVSPRVFDQKLISILKKEKIDLIALAGYMKRLSPSVVRKFKNKIINIHPALLPRFGGKGMYGIHVHEAVLKSKAKTSGVSVHLVDEKYDRGAIVFQKEISVRDNDTAESLQKRVLKIEHQVYPYVIGLFVRNKILIKGRKVYIRNSGREKIY
ncbi:MAG TPA: phosphoribosylglycinamide formyltransferase [candidate division Zixibacteria bacterium]|nr:phosphoribosylglycinamide formyltransferase [candidate division Zixibacteria bacterium]